MKRFAFIVRLTVSLFLLYIILSRVHAGAIMESLTSVSLWYVFPLLTISLVMVTISCLKWQLFLRGRQIDISLMSLVYYYLIGYFFNNVLPGSIGGDVLRGYLLGKDHTGHLHSFSSVFLERFTGLVALLFIGIAALTLNMRLIGEPAILTSISLMALFFLFIISFFMFPQSRSVTLHGISKLHPRWSSKIGSHFGRFYDSISYFRDQPRVLIYSMVYSFAFQFLAVVNTLVCCWALGLEPKGMDVAVIVPIIMLVSIAPISLGSIGLWEGAFSYFFVSIGISAADAVSIAIILRAKNLLLGIFGGILFALRQRETLAPKPSSMPSQ